MRFFQVKIFIKILIIHDKMADISRENAIAYKEIQKRIHPFMIRYEIFPLFSHLRPGKMKY